MKPAEEFQPYYGHVPRDRGSIWYIAQLLTNAFALVVVAFIVAAFVF